MANNIPNIHPEGRAQMKQLTSRLLFNIYLLRNLPAAWFIGCRVIEINDNKCVIKLPFSWFSQNPFRSIYFAAQCAAAELSTGLPTAVAITGKASTAMLLVGIETKFYKKADSTSYFICEEAKLAQEAVNEAILSGEAKQFTLNSVGYNEANEVISETKVSWSVKKRQAKKA